MIDILRLRLIRSPALIFSHLLPAPTTPGLICPPHWSGTPPLRIFQGSAPSAHPATLLGLCGGTLASAPLCLFMPRAAPRTAPVWGAGGTGAGACRR